MQYLNLYSPEKILSLTRQRTGETKIGEKVKTLKAHTQLEQELRSSAARFVLLGLQEDIGVRANFGRGGTHTAWQPALENILNLQENLFLTGEQLLVLGAVEFSDLMDAAAGIDTKTDEKGIEKLRQLVAQVDSRVEAVVRTIVATGKIPILIGGGHNNAYPALKGSAQALQHAVNCINCDPHTDFRHLEGRHSGNGFSYAFHEKHLSRYAAIGIHESYNTSGVMQQFKNTPESLHYCTFEDIFIRGKMSYQQAIESGINFVRNTACGIEIDLDAITNVPSSAKTSSGISALQARQYVYTCARELKACYLHIAEGAPVLAHIKADNKTGKLIAYLVSDFIKACVEKLNP